MQFHGNPVTRAADVGCFEQSDAIVFQHGDALRETKSVFLTINVCRSHLHELRVAIAKAFTGGLVDSEEFAARRMEENRIRGIVKKERIKDFRVHWGVDLDYQTSLLPVICKALTPAPPWGIFLLAVDMPAGYENCV